MAILIHKINNSGVAMSEIVGTDSKIRSRINSLREQKNLSISKLARLANLSRAGVYRAMTNDDASFTIRMLEKLAPAVGTTLRDLMPDEGGALSGGSAAVVAALHTRDPVTITRAVADYLESVRGSPAVLPDQHFDQIVLRINDRDFRGAVAVLATMGKEWRDD